LSKDNVLIANIVYLKTTVSY